MESTEDWEETKGMCPPGLHQWRHRVCMVCTVCRECTGYSISCLSSIRPDRNPGQYVYQIICIAQEIKVCIFRECGCGEGDSGCAECGCCRTCARKSCANGKNLGFQN